MAVPLISLTIISAQMLSDGGEGEPGVVHPVKKVWSAGKFVNFMCNTVNFYGGHIAFMTNFCRRRHMTMAFLGSTP